MNLYAREGDRHTNNWDKRWAMNVITEIKTMVS